MARQIKVTFKNESKVISETTVESGTQVFSIIKNFNLPEEDIFGVKINNEICSLEKRIQFTATIEPIMKKTKDGAAIYRRSLCLLLASAAHKLYPQTRLLVGHSLGYGYYYNLDDGKEDTQEVIDSIKNEMTKMVEKNIPIVTERISYAEATELFDKLGLKETRKQLKYISSSSVKINTIDGFSDLYFGPLVRSTGILKTFELKKYGQGFLLRFPRHATPDELPEFHDEPKLFEVYQKYKDWGRRINVTSAASLNELVAQRKINDFIEITETFQQKNFSKIASQIIERKTVRVVLIAGPSSSGKTTSAKKLALELQALGYTPKVISLDCYYAGKDKTPLDENGQPDFECLEALNIELLNQNLMDLFAGKEINLPSYDFHTGTSYFEEDNTMTLGKNEILIMEGIHGLNDKLTPKVPAEYKFKIYLSALTQLNLDHHNRVSTSDNRLIRRIVR
ncbi:MAG: nucleoside kinase, partial [Treponema sp.]|nr:nucleoside kinase [Treponema sp.]